MRDDFLKYMRIEDRQNTPVISLAELPVDVDTLSTVPECVQGRVNQYCPEFKPGGECIDTESGCTLNFDMKKQYSADLLVQERAGGGINSYWLLQHLRPTTLLRETLRERLAGLPKGYVSLHIRNTDLQTDYKNFATSIAWALRGRDVLVGTDSGEVQSQLPELDIGARAFHFLTDLDPTHKDRLHDAGTTNEVSNLEMLSDFFALALGDRLYFTFTSQGYVSGFSGLAFGLSHSSLARSVAKDLGRDRKSSNRTFGAKGLTLYLRNQATLIMAKAAIMVAIKSREVFGK